MMLRTKRASDELTPIATPSAAFALSRPDTRRGASVAAEWQQRSSSTSSSARERWRGEQRVELRKQARHRRHQRSVYRYAAMCRASDGVTPTFGIAVSESTFFGSAIQRSMFCGALGSTPAM